MRQIEYSLFLCWINCLLLSVDSMFSCSRTRLRGRYPFAMESLKCKQFEAVEARFLRASFSSFVDLLILTTQLIEEYGHTPI
ncbi:hypothetical protein ZIOFF_056344 [Zingiber officinale]|uniref:Secreted protein n=1 Tax=Zingiber officinale TaxID=94328 RepID=A0A8J5KKZ5_ZINOF|nr:hypothetical protein ZIOFF_056344 [Zingiber officinale]